jgi:hypothetical protein
MGDRLQPDQRSGDLMASLQKNVAGQNVTFCLVNASTGAALTGATFTSLAWVTKDNGSQAGFAGTFTSCGNGQYNYAPTQSETNATDIGIFIAPSGAVPVNLDFHTDVVDGNGLLQVDLVDIAGSAVSTSSAQLGVNLVDIAGSAVSTSTAQLGVNAVNIAGQAATLDGNNLLEVDVVDWNGHAVSTPATAGIPDVNVKNYNNQTAATDANNLPKVDVEAMNANETAVQNVAHSMQSICRGTVGSGSTTTSIVTSAFTPGVGAAGQFIGRTVIFDANTTTTALQGQATNITGSTNASDPVLTVTALTSSPVSGDTFLIV